MFEIILFEFEKLIYPFEMQEYFFTKLSYTRAMLRFYSR